jgi:hypothetical protein
MEASTFFSRLLRQPKVAAQVVEPDDIGEFDKAWRTVKVGVVQTFGGHNWGAY